MDNTTVKQDELTEVLEAVRTEGIVCSVSHLAKGLWHVAEARICAENRLTLQLELSGESEKGDLAISIDQPVGITFQYEFSKYMFETTVVGFEPAIEGGCCRRIMVTRPTSGERMHRRAYERVAVPDELHVDVLFWHRGYTDGQNRMPIENYWQSSLLDLSAGGVLAEIDRSHEKDFRRGQLVGLQFTPLPYEKPLLFEGQIKHIACKGESDKLQLGIEFMGLGASSDGREKLGRITETVSMYTEYDHTDETKVESN